MFDKKLLLCAVLFPFVALGSGNKDAVSKGIFDDLYFKVNYEMMYDVNQTIVGGSNASVTNSAAVDPLTVNMVLDYSNAYIRKNTITSSGSYKPNYYPNYMMSGLGVGKYFDFGRLELEFALDNTLNIRNNAEKMYSNTFSMKDDQGNQGLFTDSGFSFSSLMFNLFYDVDETFTSLRPYIAGGVGISQVKFFGNGDSYLPLYPLAFQIKTGVQILITDKLPLYFGYKYMHFLNVKSSSNISSVVPITAPAIPQLDYACDNPTKIERKAVPATEQVATKLNTSYTMQSIEIGLNISV